MKNKILYMNKGILLAVFFLADVFGMAYVFANRSTDAQKFWNISAQFSIWVMAGLLLAIAAYLIYFFKKKEFLSGFHIKGKVAGILLAIILAGTVLRLNQPVEHSIFFDEDIYLQSSQMIGQNLTSGQCFFGKFVGGRLNCLVEDKRYGALQKGYPMLLAIFFKAAGQSEWAAFYFNIMLGILSIALMFYIGRELGGCETGILAAGLLAALPAHIHWSVSTSSDVPALFFLASSLLIFLFSLRLKSFDLLIFSMLILVYAGFIRSEMLLAFPVFALIFFAQKNSAEFLASSWGNCLKFCLLSVFAALNILGSLISFGPISGFVNDLFSTQSFLSPQNLKNNLPVILNYHLYIKDYTMAILLFGFAAAVFTLPIRPKPERRKIYLIAALGLIFFGFYASLAAGAYGYNADIATIRYTLSWSALLILASSFGWSFLIKKFTGKFYTFGAAVFIFALALYSFTRYEVIIPKSGNFLKIEERAELRFEKAYPQCLFVVPHPGISLFSGYSSVDYGNFYQMFSRKRYPFFSEQCVIFFRSGYCNGNKICDKIFPLAAWERLNNPDIPTYKLRTD